MQLLGPRLVVAGTHSGVGKTTVATGLVASLARRGLAVGPAKVGPDFIDPSYLALAASRPARNLDAFLCGVDAIPALAARAAQGCDLLVVEGVMGLFDGAGVDELADGPVHAGSAKRGGGPVLRAEGIARREAAPGALPLASTAQTAALLDAPVLLVVDASAMSGSVAALVHGFSTYSPFVRVGGVVLNRVGGDAHEAMLREALEPLGVPVLGALRRDPHLAWPERHLGLVPAVERRGELSGSLERLAAAVEASFDLEGVLRLARSADPLRVRETPRPTRSVGRARVAVASGPAFSFVYRDNLERLAEAGAELVFFDPLEEMLPDHVNGVYLGGGFPEVFCEALSANAPARRDLAARVQAGLPTWAECGGLLYLCRSLDGRPLCGVIPASATMTDRLSLGYRVATARSASPVAGLGEELRGHEFHYAVVEPDGEALELRGRTGARRSGFATPTMLASFLHVHLGSDPTPAERFVAAAARSTHAGAGRLG